MSQVRRTPFVAFKEALRCGSRPATVEPGGRGVRTVRGWAGIGRLDELTRALDHAAQTGLIDVELAEAGCTAGHGSGAAARNAAALTRLLEALARTREHHQYEVQAQASDLLAPLTLLKANLEVLRRTPDLNPAVQAALLRELDTGVRLLASRLEDLVALVVEPAAEAHGGGTPAERQMKRSAPWEL